MAVSRPLFCVRKWARGDLWDSHMPHISPSTHQLEKTLEVTFIAKAKISLVLLAFLICWRRIFSSLPAHPLVFPGLSVGCLKSAPSSFTLVTPRTLGSFVLQLLFCVRAPLTQLCMSSPGLGGPLSPHSFTGHCSPSRALLCTVSRWADSPRTHEAPSHQIYQFGVRRMWSSRRWGRWYIFHPFA